MFTFLQWYRPVRDSDNRWFFVCKLVANYDLLSGQLISWDYQYQFKRGDVLDRCHCLSHNCRLVLQMPPHFIRDRSDYYRKLEVIRSEVEAEKSGDQGFVYIGTTVRSSEGQSLMAPLVEVKVEGQTAAYDKRISVVVREEALAQEEVEDIEIMDYTEANCLIRSLRLDITSQQWMRFHPLQCHLILFERG